jgi:hypothetical protein
MVTWIRNLKVYTTLRGNVLLAAAACIVAATSYLWCDPDAPYSLLVYEKKTKTGDDPDRTRRAIEEWDYLIADPWGLGYEPEGLEVRQRHRASWVRRLEELESP